MNTAQLLYDIEQLPPEAQHQIEDFIVFIKTRYQSVESKCKPDITQGDKNINPAGLFGLWAEQPRNLTEIRKQAWQRSESE
ncbi:MAG: hypothetical protein PHO08_02450 [Methylococcales bacterium]|nr:hypothetical protein [Methylococcales bacterium]MDD5632407.1 hypothetical protein [Methylococcales bacterium]